jgi:ABC-2 type transport system permease protein
MRRREVYDEPHAARVLTVSTARRAARPGALWGLAFGILTAATASAYPSVFPTAASRVDLARSVEGNVGLTALFGPVKLDTLAGYTAYKTMSYMVVLAAIWGLLLATRLLRGEEEEGRLELFLSGRTTRGRAAVQVAIGLSLGVVALWTPTALLTAGAGARPAIDIGVGASLFFATAIAASAAMFMAVGMLVSQLAASRHQANQLGAGILAASYLVRMAADSAPELAWLRWATPLGWIEELRALTGSTPLAFLPIAALIAVLVVVSVRLATTRDLGASAIAGRDTPEPHTLLLGGEAGLTLRLTRSSVVAWVVALAATGLIFGLVAQAAGSAVRSSPAIERAIARMGGVRAGAASYLGLVFVVAAGLVAIAVAGQISALRNEESAGHLENLLVRPVARWRWLAVRLGVGAGLVVLASVVAGLAAWVGAATQNSGLGLGELLQAGLNVTPPAIFVLGIGALAFGLVPRWAIAVVYALVVWSFIAETVSSITTSGHWLGDTSPLAHITPAPAAEPNWAAGAWLVGLGLAAAAAGVVAFGRRDLAGA